MQQPLEQLGSPFEADVQPEIAAQPGKRAFDHPAAPPESLTGVYAAVSNRGVMARARRARRRGQESYALSACNLAGRLRGRPGRPRGPMIDGMASTSGISCVASWALAAERRRASGTPFRSTTTWYLEPGLPRSTGLGPVCSPPFSPVRSNYPGWRGSNR